MAVMAAPVTTPVLAAPVTVTTSVKVCAPLASPAQAAKSGRQRGLSVLERHCLEMESLAAADRAAAAKRWKGCEAPAISVVDPSLPNGVGTQGRGRSGMNSPLANGSDCVVAMQQRRQSLLAAAEYRQTRTVIVLTTAGAGKFDGMPDRDQYPEGSEGEAEPVCIGCREIH